MTASHGETGLPENELPRATRRRVLGGAAAGGVAGLFATTLLQRASAQEAANWETASLPLPPFSYNLEASEPQHFTGGTLRTATSSNIPALEGFAIFSESIDAGALRELHWHSNCHELSYCLSGEGTIGIHSPKGDSATFAISTGSVTFVPLGYAHFIQNSGAEPLRMIIAFTNEQPQKFDLSMALPWVPGELIAQTLSVTPGTIPMLPQQGDLTIVPAEQPADLELTKENPYSTPIDQVPLQEYAGGTASPVSTAQISALEEVTVFGLNFDHGGLREPHWHTNAAEFDYVLSGTAQFTLVAPDGSATSFAVGPGEVAYMPQNWFHYIADIGKEDEPLKMLIFFSNVKPDHVDLSQMTGFFPPEVLAASFGFDPSVFADLPEVGDVFMAGK